MTNRPYIDFYSEHGSKLVSREIVDVNRFFGQREGLFLTLGLPPGFVRGKTVLEFGPGTGHNSIHTDSLLPARYVLVDGGDEILEAAEKRLVATGNKTVEREFVLSLFDEFQTEEQFDLVIAEACIPNQIDPIATFQKIRQFVKPGGLMIFTTVSAASWLSEIVRRLVKIEGLAQVAEIPDKLEFLETKLSNHFAAVDGMSRSPREWILDNLIQPLHGRLFTIPDAVSDLPLEFVVSGTSPQFFQDWRWYKEIDLASRVSQQALVDNYFSNVANLIDRRVINPPHSPDIGRALESLSLTVWDDIRALEKNCKASRDSVYEGLKEISVVIREPAPLTASALHEAIDWIKSGLMEIPLEHFPTWWGRGQQHVGIYRRG